MKERITKLLSVKSIMTIFLSGVFCYLSVVGRISSTEFMTVFTMITAFYFGTQVDKNGR